MRPRQLKRWDAWTNRHPVGAATIAGGLFSGGTTLVYRSETSPVGLTIGVASTAALGFGAFVYVVSRRSRVKAQLARGPIPDGPPAEAADTGN